MSLRDWPPCTTSHCGVVRVPKSQQARSAPTRAHTTLPSQTRRQAEIGIRRVLALGDASKLRVESSVCGPLSNRFPNLCCGSYAVIARIITAVTTPCCVEQRHDIFDVHESSIVMSGSMLDTIRCAQACWCKLWNFKAWEALSADSKGIYNLKYLLETTEYSMCVYTTDTSPITGRRTLSNLPR